MTALFTAPSVDEIIAKLGAQSTCDAGLTQDPVALRTPTTPSYGPGASMLDRLPANAPRQQVLPDESARPPTRNCSSASPTPSSVSAPNC